MNIRRYAMHEVWLCKNVPDVFTLVEFDNTQRRATHTARQRTDTDPHTDRRTRTIPYTTRQRTDTEPHTHTGRDGAERGERVNPRQNWPFANPDSDSANRTRR